MTLSETILRTHDQLVLKENIDIPVSDETMILPTANLIREVESIFYRDALKESPDSGFIKLLIESAKAYGEAKWNEGMQAARDAQCSDKNTPPKFIP